MSFSRPEQIDRGERCPGYKRELKWRMRRWERQLRKALKVLPRQFRDWSL